MEAVSESDRKKRARSEKAIEGLASRHGDFLRALRKRAQLKTEELAEALGYKGPTQVIRREAGAISIQLSEAAEVSRLLRIDIDVLLLARMMAFEKLYFERFGRLVLAALGYPPDLSPAGFFRAEIAGIAADTGSGMWRGARPFS